MPYTFPYDPTNGNPLSKQAILLGVASASNGVPVFQVSAVNSLTATTTPLSADSSKVSAIQGDAGLLHVSAVASDAGLFRVSAIGGTGGDRTIVDGTTQTISATLTPISATPAGSVAGLVVNTFQVDAGQQLVSAKQGDAGLLRVSAIATLSANQQISAVLLASTANVGFVSSMQSDAGQQLVSSHNSDAALLRVSALVFDAEYSAGPNVIVSATATPATSSMKSLLATVISLSAGTLLTSAKSGDGNQFHVSAVQGDAALQHVSAFTSTATNFPVSAVQADASLQRVSAILAAGVSSVGAASFGVSAAQIDAGVLHVSAFASTATNLPVSATQADASLLRTSSFGSVVTTNIGGASLYFTSSGATSQVSTVKSTPGRLYGYHIGNPAGVDQYLQVFNTSGGATAGTDTPTLTLYIPTLGGAVMSPGVGIGFSTGIQIIGTSTANGQTIGASALRINLFYA